MPNEFDSDHLRLFRILATVSEALKMRQMLLWSIVMTMIAGPFTSSISQQMVMPEGARARLKASVPNVTRALPRQSGHQHKGSEFCGRRPDAGHDRDGFARLASIATSDHAKSTVVGPAEGRLNRLPPESDGQIAAVLAEFQRPFALMVMR